MWNLFNQIDNTMKDIETFYDQIGNVQRAVRDFHSLDDAMDGKGSEAIRAFYRDCHEPFLILLHQSMIDYKNVLSQMEGAIDSLESGEGGYISQAFLDGEVMDALDKVEKKAVNYTADANSIIDTVSDIVSIPEIDESGLVDYVQLGRTTTNELIGNLHELDTNQVSAMASVKEDLHIMEAYISELESLFNDGDFSISDYNLSAMREIDAFRAVTESVYGEDWLIVIILNKMKNGEPLTELEGSDLYEYFQNEVMNDKRREEIKDIADLINEQDIDKLKDYLNDKVLNSKKSLEEEIALIEAFLFTANENHFDLGYVETDSRQKLAAYLTMLKDYHSAIVSDDIYELHAHTLEYQDQPNGVNEHVLKTELELKAKIDDHDPDGFFDMSRALGGSYFYDGEITYYSTMDATVFRSHLETQKLLDKEATFTRDFIASKILSTVVGALAKEGAPIVDGYVSIAEHQAELNELRDDITIEDAIEPAGYLKMEFSITENQSSLANHGDSKDTARHMSNDLHVERHPTQETYAILKRWKEAHSYNSEIPYPEDAIQSQD